VGKNSLTFSVAKVYRCGGEIISYSGKNGCLVHFLRNLDQIGENIVVGYLKVLYENVD
jgi:hypothetical protein